jgi:hypothetical protein
MQYYYWYSSCYMSKGIIEATRRCSKLKHLFTNRRPGNPFPLCSFRWISGISSHPAVFFSHNKPANSTFSHNKPTKRTGRRGSVMVGTLIFYSTSYVQEYCIVSTYRNIYILVYIYILKKCSASQLLARMRRTF